MIIKLLLVILVFWLHYDIFDREIVYLLLWIRSLSCELSVLQSSLILILKFVLGDLRLVFSST